MLVLCGGLQVGGILSYKKRPIENVLASRKLTINCKCPPGVLGTALHGAVTSSAGDWLQPVGRRTGEPGFEPPVRRLHLETNLSLK